MNYGLVRYEKNLNFGGKFIKRNLESVDDIFHVHVRLLRQFQGPEMKRLLCERQE